MPRRLLACAVLAAAVFVAAAALAAGTVATVRDAEVVNVRRGPSRDTPALAQLRKGAKVTVESLSGSWAVVRLASGERGYVNAAYLALPARAAVPPRAEAPTGASTADVPPTETPEALAVDNPAGAETPAVPVMEQRLEQALERIKALESTLSTPSPAAASGPAVHTPPLPLGLASPTSDDELSDLRGIAPAMALAGVGFVVGFVLGAVYGRRQERNRRSRVRF